MQPSKILTSHNNLKHLSYKIYYENLEPKFIKIWKKYPVIFLLISKTATKLNFEKLMDKMYNISNTNQQTCKNTWKYVKIHDDVKKLEKSRFILAKRRHLDEFCFCYKKLLTFINNRFNTMFKIT